MLSTDIRINFNEKISKIDAKNGEYFSNHLNETETEFFRVMYAIFHSLNSFDRKINAFLECQENRRFCEKSVFRLTKIIIGIKLKPKAI